MKKASLRLLIGDAWAEIAGATSETVPLKQRLL